MKEGVHESSPVPHAYNGGPGFARKVPEFRRGVPELWIKGPTRVPQQTG